MTTFDWVLLTILVIFVFHGFRQGLIMAFGGLASFVVGAYVATAYFPDLAKRLELGVWSVPVAFFAIFLLVSYVMGLGFWLLNKLFHFMSFLPFAKTLNRILGGVFGFLQGVFVISVVLYVLDRYFFFIHVEDFMGGSVLSDSFTSVGRLLSPIMPSLVREIETFVPKL